MARIKNLSRRQLKNLKNQVKANREKAIQEMLEEDPEKAQEKLEDLRKRKDKIGLTRDDRQNLAEKLTEINKKTTTISWNYDVGQLVRLPNGDVGLIVRNEAKEMKLNNYEYDMKKAMKGSKYYGQVYVVTSSGNNWYYPKQLRLIREN